MHAMQTPQTYCTSATFPSLPFTHPNPSDPLRKHQISHTDNHPRLQTTPLVFPQVPPRRLPLPPREAHRPQQWELAIHLLKLHVEYVHSIFPSFAMNMLDRSFSPF